MTENDIIEQALNPHSTEQLYLHRNLVLNDPEGKRVRGDVVSYLPMSDWAQMRGYKVIALGTTKKLPGFSQKRTKLR